MNYHQSTHTIRDSFSDASLTYLWGPASLSSKKKWIEDACPRCENGALSHLFASKASQQNPRVRSLEFKSCDVMETRFEVTCETVPGESWCSKNEVKGWNLPVAKWWVIPVTLVVPTIFFGNSEFVVLQAGKYSLHVSQRSYSTLLPKFLVLRNLAAGTCDFSCQKMAVFSMFQRCFQPGSLWILCWDW